MYVSDVHGTAPFTHRPTPCKKYSLSAIVDQSFSDLRLKASLFAMCVYQRLLIFFMSLVLGKRVLCILFR